MELCTTCNEGYMRPTGNVGVTESSDTREYICDKCGARKVVAKIEDDV